jgi:hypothetical protein
MSTIVVVKLPDDVETDIKPKNIVQYALRHLLQTMTWDEAAELLGERNWQELTETIFSHVTEDVQALANAEFGTFIVDVQEPEMDKYGQCITDEEED